MRLPLEKKEENLYLTQFHSRKAFFVPKFVNINPALPNQEIDSKIEESFWHIKESQSWDWLTLHPLATIEPVPHCERPGNILRVVACYLQPKNYTSMQI